VSGEELAVDLVELGKVVHRLEVDVDLDDVLEVASDRSEHLQRGPLSEKKNTALRTYILHVCKDLEHLLVERRRDDARSVLADQAAQVRELAVDHGRLR